MELLRAAGPVRRAGMMRSLSATTIAMARAALRRRHPEASEDELAVVFVELHYGAELARGYEAFLARRR